MILLVASLLVHFWDTPACVEPKGCIHYIIWTSWWNSQLYIYILWIYCNTSDSRYSQNSPRPDNQNQEWPAVTLCWDYFHLQAEFGWHLFLLLFVLSSFPLPVSLTLPSFPPYLALLFSSPFSSFSPSSHAGLAATNDTDNAELFSIVDATGDAWFQIYAAIFHEKDEKRKVAE